jgi:hypothetical protein
MESLQTKNMYLFGHILEGLKMENIGALCGHLYHFTSIWVIAYLIDGYVMWLSGIFSPVLVCCTKETLATLVVTEDKEKKD